MQLRNADSHVADTGRSRNSFPLTLDRAPRHWAFYHYVTNHRVSLLPINGSTLLLSPSSRRKDLTDNSSFAFFHPVTSSRPSAKPCLSEACDKITGNAADSDTASLRLLFQIPPCTCCNTHERAVETGPCQHGFCTSMRYRQNARVVATDPDRRIPRVTLRYRSN